MKIGGSNDSSKERNCMCILRRVGQFLTLYLTIFGLEL